MLRRAAVIAAGLAMATSFGLAAVGAASAAAPALHIKPGAIWTIKEKANGGGCEQEKFAANGIFHAATSHGGNDAGTWSGGRSTIHMSWTAGGDAGIAFKGNFVSSTGIYKGLISANGSTVATNLIHKPVPGC